ncbi:MAG: VWA domain-containing protein [Candidatus Melainabacteria bacterium]|nr:VWA domain-containing protein [Candidatus Melainabacteria bacterium]
MNIKHPELLFLIVLIPAGIFFLYTLWNRRQKVLQLLARPSRIRTLFPNSSNAKSFLRFALLALTLTMFVTALISPRWGYDWKEVETQGTNIIVALDLSKSMLAEDISPSRLARAKFEINKLIDKLSGDRIGLIIFAGDAFLQSPLTHDYLMVKDWVTRLTVDSVETPGTSIKAALAKARKAFKYIKSEGKALIIMSDGEEHDEATLEEAKGAKSEGIRIYTIGIGTAKGAPVQYKGTLVRNQAGEVVISRLDDSFLKELAEAGSGEYVRSSGSDFHLDQLYYDHIKTKIDDELVKSGRSKKWYETYQIFLGIALIALLFELILSLNMGVYNTVRTWFVRRLDSSFERLRLRRKTGIFVLLIMFFVPVQANPVDPRLWQADAALQAESFTNAREQYLKLQVENPQAPRLNYNLGIAHYREGVYDQARASFTRSANLAQDETLKESALYNLGNACFKLADYEAAVEAYEAALKIWPEDEDAKHNLELAKEQLEKEENEDEDEEGDGEKEEQQDQQQQQNKDQNKDDQNKDEDQQNQPQNKPKPKPEPQLSPQDIENLLRQVNEAKPSEVKDDQQQGPTNPNVKLNPW